MLKKTITYEDFNGTETSEDFFFHLSKADLIELEMSHKDGLGETLQRIVDAGDGAQIMKEFKNLLLQSYGQRSEDGRRFIKTEELRKEFESSEAYSTLFVELVTDADAAAEFVNGIVPANLEAEVNKIGKKTPDVVTEEPKPENKVESKVETETPKPRVLTSAEVYEMDSDELKSGLAEGRFALGE